MAVLSHAAVEPNHENYLAINYQITVIILKLNIHCILSFGCNECDVSKQMHENTKKRFTRIFLRYIDYKNLNQTIYEESRA